MCDLEFFPSLSIDDEQASVGDARLGKAIAATDVLHSDTLGLSKQVRLTKIVDKAHKRCFRDFRVSYSNCVAVFFVLALAADQ